MITADEIFPAGKFGKPHGINGEIAATLDVEADDLDAGNCVVAQIDGIYVPFFIEKVRPKNAETVLFTIEGIKTDTDASMLANHPLWLLRREFDFDEEQDADGFYASDLIGFRVTDDGKEIGTITDFNDSTENVLFVVETKNGDEIFIPVADELIDSVDTDNKIINMTLPSGLTNL